MALSIDQGTAIIEAEKAEHPVLNEVNSPSEVSIWKLTMEVFSSAASFISTLFDSLKLEIQSIAANLQIGGVNWIGQKVLEFQVGYVLQVIDNVPKYAVIDPAARIITRRSVLEQGNNKIRVKVAKNEPPEPLDSTEVTQLKGYLEKIRFAGTRIEIVNLPSDKVYLAGTITYLGEYATVIAPNVISAITAYYAQLSSATNFNGFVNLNEVIQAVRSVEGVDDFKPTELSIRPDGSTFISRTKIYELATGINNQEAPSVSGYVVEETESGFALADSLIFQSLV